MILSDLSVRRPVLAVVISLLLIAFGAVAFDLLPLREYPDIDPPVVSIETAYRGASAAVVETRITQQIEDRISGIAGVESIASSSMDGVSEITIEFSLERDIDAAANDVRDRVGGVLDQLPREADAPDIRKQDSSGRVILWMSLVSDRLDRLELTDYANRYIADRFAVIDGVAQVYVSGGLDYAMRIWLDRNALAARSLTVADVEAALERENVELPAGSIRSTQRDFVVRMERGYRSVGDFRALVLGKGSDGYLVRLGDVAEVELGAAENRKQFRANGVPMVGIGIIKQSTANTLAVARAVKRERDRANLSLPDGMQLLQSWDSSVYIESAIDEVYKTLAIAALLVVAVIWLFLGDMRAMLVPAATLPVSLVATCIVLYFFGYSINLLTLLALVLAIGLVVDDAIVVLENVHRRIRGGESPLVAAFRGTRQVGFAVVATTLVLVAVFVPITFLQDDIGRLFGEFAIAMTAAVLFSMLVALTLSPAMCSSLLRPGQTPHGFGVLFTRAQLGYRARLASVLHHPWIALVLIAVVLAGTGLLYRVLPSEFAPREDRGSFFMFIKAPEGSSYEYTRKHVDEIESRLMPMVADGEIERMLMRVPGGFSRTESYNEAIGIFNLPHWNTGRRPGMDILADVNRRIADVPGVQAFPTMPQGLGGRFEKPLQFVIGGGTYEELAAWRDILLERMARNPGLSAVDHDYKETKPQLRVAIDRARAGDLGVSVENVGRTLETLLGSRRVTKLLLNGEEYDVILEGLDATKRTAANLASIYVRSQSSGALIPLASLVSIEEFADAGVLNRYNRTRAITIEANLEEGYALGEAIDFMERSARESLPARVVTDLKGESRDLRDSGRSIYLIFLLSLLIVYLVLAAQFESFLHPLVIMLTVPLAVAGALLGLWLTGQTLNIYSQIGIIMLVGLAAKNGILIVEFANQLRGEGMAREEALLEAASLRLRPIVMTAITTIMGAMPLVLAYGAGAEARYVIGVVVVAGVLVSTVLSLLVVPLTYHLLTARAGLPGATGQRLERELGIGQAGSLPEK
ncbi:MAG: efflux RND transporter permease subunit [Gammaproteobacteria bacterium]|jgi:multidrug efflux pump|nr:efflux RND transporter permease subunit [Gammaproteobacteria bacterium]MBK7519196.1 efflux RND transporter permease subunit [Gammaproteobacteria bacterium]MBK7730063.1 efflux RND transporter permease subunit [Gammaproteobacteria bacterium]MBK9666086.1 efflux RND transporter permease subunit [Gammaproteobacteria bacterium]MBP6052509.1 efflux RND transporter permease subunit [Pseudomonadales bacterium]